jgi:hypothetical protein
MRLRPRRGYVVVWSSSGAPGGGSSSRRPTRARRIRWWFRTGTLLALFGVVRLARATWVRGEPVALVVGGLLMVIGFVLPAASVAFFPGMMVLLIALLRGIKTKGRAASAAADCWQWRG